MNVKDRFSKVLLIVLAAVSIIAFVLFFSTLAELEDKSRVGGLDWLSLITLVVGWALLLRSLVDTKTPKR